MYSRQGSQLCLVLLGPYLLEGLARGEGVEDLDPPVRACLDHPPRASRQAARAIHAIEVPVRNDGWWDKAHARPLSPGERGQEGLASDPLHPCARVFCLYG